MACATRKMCLILPLIVLLSITSLSSSSFSPTDKVTKELVDQLCSTKPIYKHFCVAWLNSDPKTFTVDLHGLVDMVIQKTVLMGYKILEMTKSLAMNTTDPILKIQYGSCITYYELSNKALEVAREFVSSKDYLLASKAAFKADDSIGMCEALLEQQPIPPYLYRSNLMFERMCSIDDVFSSLLTS